MESGSKLCVLQLLSKSTLGFRNSKILGDPTFYCLRPTEGSYVTFQYLGYHTIRLKMADVKIRGKRKYVLFPFTITIANTLSNTLSNALSNAITNTITNAITNTITNTINNTITNTFTNTITIIITNTFTKIITNTITNNCLDLCLNTLISSTIRNSSSKL